MLRYILLVAVCVVALFDLTQCTKSKGVYDLVIDSKTGMRAKGIGCFKDQQSDRAFGENGMYFNARDKIDWALWNNLSYIVGICMEKAASHQPMKIFSVQNWGECWGEPNMKYNKHGYSTDCFSGVGASYANAVYEIIGFGTGASCNIKGKNHPDKSHFYIPQNPVNVKNVGCTSCRCNEGIGRCIEINCDQFTNAKCEKYIPGTPEKCCPTCACVYKGKQYSPNEQWVNRDGAVCKECRCSLKGEQRCEAKACPTKCANPEYVPHQCCPNCRPGRPTTRPRETIPVTTVRPRPTFPPFMRPPGMRKRSAKKRNSSLNK